MGGKGGAVPGGRGRDGRRRCGGGGCGESLEGLEVFGGGGRGGLCRGAPPEGEWGAAACSRLARGAGCARGRVGVQQLAGVVGGGAQGRVGGARSAGGAQGRVGVQQFARGLEVQQGLQRPGVHGVGVRAAAACVELQHVCRGCVQPSSRVPIPPQVPPPPPIPPPVPPWRCAPWTAFSSLPTRMSSWGGLPRSWSTSCCRGSTTGRGTVWHRGVRALPCIGPMGFAWRGWEPWQLLQPGCRALCCRAPILPEDAQSIIWLCPGFESDLIPDAAISDGPEMAKNMGGFSWDGVAQFRDPVS